MSSLRWEFWQNLCVVANDLGPRDGDPHAITGALCREGPLRIIAAETSRDTASASPEAKTSTSTGTEAGAAGCADSVC